jgi:predicted enzyme related to lactoylglutathione lyase
MARVTGIGGVFIRSTTSSEALTKWYYDVLGMELESFGAVILRWEKDTSPDQATVWHTANPDSQWFAPSTAPFMINYRVDDMAGLLERVRAHGVAVHKGPEQHENGIFAWVIDPDGNKVELWQPQEYKPK